MTKNLPATTTDKYIDMMGLKFAAGRSAIAQELHMVGGSEWSDGVGRKPTKSGRDPAKSVEKTTYNKSGESSSSTQLSLPLFDIISNDPVREKGVDLRDLWCCSGDNGMWKREHCKPRTTLFTPLRVAQGPSRDAQLLKICVTRGIRVDSGQVFSVSDDWTQSNNAHRILPFAWIGTTTFQCASDFVVECDDNANKHENRTLESPCVGSVSSLGYSHTTSTEPTTQQQQHTQMSSTCSSRSPSTSARVRGRCPVAAAARD